MHQPFSTPFTSLVASIVACLTNVELWLPFESLWRKSAMRVFLNGHGMVLGFVANCCLDSFPVWVMNHYLIELINWSEFGAYIRWRQRMINQDLVQVRTVSLKKVVVDDSRGV